VGKRFPKLQLPAHKLLRAFAGLHHKPGPLGGSLENRRPTSLRLRTGSRPSLAKSLLSALLAASPKGRWHIATGEIQATMEYY
jgi:RNA:NAD 2'-phosphotransferase (TPT1/KptA family)